MSSALDNEADAAPAPPQQRERRVRRRLAVAIVAPGQGQVAGFTSNLAVHGLSVGATRVFPVGTELRLSVQLPDQERASLAGKVTWVRRGISGGVSAMGVRLSADCEPWTAFLRRFHPELFGAA